MNIPTKPNAKDLHTLSLTLREAFASASTEKSKKWFEEAYRTTKGNPNLNTLLTALMPKYSAQESVHLKAFQSVLAIALLHDDGMRDTYLETLLLHLESAPEGCLERFRERLKHYAGTGVMLNHETRRPEHLALLFMITQSSIKTQNHYITELIDHIHALKDSATIMKSIGMLEKLCNYSAEFLAYRYTSSHVYNDISINPHDPREMNLLRAIFTSDTSLMNHIVRVLKLNISQLLEYDRFLDDGKTIPFTKNKLDDLIAVIRLALTPNTLPKLTEALREEFEVITQPNWRHEQVQTAMHAIEPVLLAIIEQLESLGIDIKSIIVRAFNTNERGEYNGKTDYMDSVADALFNCHQAPIKRMLAVSAIKPLSTEEAVKIFHNRPEVIAEIYKITNNSELIRHMNNRARHASISHDLGL